VEIDRLQGIIKKLSTENENLKKAAAAGGSGTSISADKVNALLLENDRLRSTVDKLTMEGDTNKIKHGRILELESKYLIHIYP